MKTRYSDYLKSTIDVYWIEQSCVQQHHANIVYVSYPKYLYLHWLGEIPHYLFFRCFFSFFGFFFSSVRLERFEFIQL